MKATSMAKTAIEIMFTNIDKLTKDQQVHRDLSFLIQHYSTMKDYGIKDDMIVDLFNKGLLAMALEETINGLKG